MLLVLKLLGCGLLLLALALGGAACSVKTPTEGVRSERVDQFKILEAEKAASARKKASQAAQPNNARSETSASAEALAVKPVKPAEKQEEKPAAPVAVTQSPSAPAAEVAVAPSPANEAARIENLAPVSGGENFTLYFKRGSTEYAKDSQTEIRTVVRLLQEHPEWRAVIEGYTDSRGDPETNLYLSNHRAQRLKASLQRQAGVEPERLAAKGYGATNFVTENESLEGRELNRRVTVRFVRDADGSPVAPATTAALKSAPETPQTGATSVTSKAEPATPAAAQTSSTTPGQTSSAPTAPSVPTPSPAPVAFSPQSPLQLLGSGQSAFASASKTSEAPKIAPKDLALSAPTPSSEFVGLRTASGSNPPAPQLDRPSVPKAEDVVYTPLPGDGNLLAKRHYIEISVSRCALSLYELQFDGSKRLVKEYKVATAKKGTPYPEGVGMVTAIETNPWWFPTDNMKRRAASRGQTLEPVPPGSKSNPMGAIKIHLSHENNGGSYRIHGTNAPTQIGRRVSLGCVRMHNNEGLELAKTIEVGTEVNIMY